MGGTDAGQKASGDVGCQLLAARGLQQAVDQRHDPYRDKR